MFHSFVHFVTIHARVLIADLIIQRKNNLAIEMQEMG